MRQGHTYFSVKPFFWHAVAATISVIVFPILAVVALLLVVPQLHLLIVALAGVVLSIFAMVVGNTLWSSRVEAGDVSFSDLMVWRWFVRHRAEDTLEEGARLLGLDRSGQPVDDVRIHPEQQLKVLKDLTAALESKDPYTHGHSQRVERHVYRTAAAMHLALSDIDDLRKAAALHDVGKIRVPDRILRKPDNLTDEERHVIEEHAVVGAWMVSSVGNADVIAAVRHHHERWDGAGYPDGLTGSEVPLFARIIAVADAYDAITSSRPYRSSSGRDDACSVLRECAGTQFDPDVVEAFIAALPARLPVTAGLFLILGGGPQRLLRAFASWLKRMGAGSLSPAVGATGAALVLGASVFTPSVPTPRADEVEIAAPAQEQTTDVGALPRTTKRAGSQEVKVRRQPKQVADLRSDDGAIVLGVRLNRDVDGGEPQPLELDADPTPPKEKPDEPKPDPTHTPTPTKSDEAEPEPAKTNPNDGRDDCPSDGNAGKGNDEDCGD
ncbi:MAG TPA: HD-GYP domain-containing protein [Actinomycetota bacterium]|nr:HD-GYP domain-containing protein [Actinomycetota bacterium]